MLIATAYQVFSYTNLFSKTMHSFQASLYFCAYVWDNVAGIFLCHPSSSVLISLLVSIKWTSCPNILTLYQFSPYLTKLAMKVNGCIWFSDGWLLWIVITHKLVFRGSNVQTRMWEALVASVYAFCIPVTVICITIKSYVEYHVLSL